MSCVGTPMPLQTILYALLLLQCVAAFTTTHVLETRITTVVVSSAYITGAEHAKHESELDRVTLDSNVASVVPTAVMRSSTETASCIKNTCTRPPESIPSSHLPVRTDSQANNPLQSVLDVLEEQMDTPSAVPRDTPFTNLPSTGPHVLSRSPHPDSYGNKTLHAPEIRQAGPEGCFPECKQLYNDIYSCYQTRGQFDPNDRGQSDLYRECFCEYRGPGIPAPPFRDCEACFIRSHLNITAFNEFSSYFRNFCLLIQPSHYLFLKGVVGWWIGGGAPTNFPKWGGDITDIARFSSVFTLPSTTGVSTGVSTATPSPPSTSPATSAVRSPSLATSSPSSTSLDTSSPSSTPLSYGLPPNWPYTKYGIVRRPGQTSTYILTNPSNGLVDAVVVAPLEWYPRPLGKQKPLQLSFKLSTISTTASLSSETPVEPPEPTGVTPSMTQQTVRQPTASSIYFSAMPDVGIPNPCDVGGCG